MGKNAIKSGTQVHSDAYETEREEIIISLKMEFNKLKSNIEVTGDKSFAIVTHSINVSRDSPSILYINTI